MILFPNAKINIGLHVVEKRPDGFHNLESCFYPVQWCDALEVVPAAETAFTMSGIEVPGEPATNLCLKAYELLKKDHPLPPVAMHLHKVIPIGAGMGGGSADAAFALKGLNELFELNLTPEQLENHARRLGSDCAFFIRNKPVYAYGKGDEFEPLYLDLSDYDCLLVYPNLHITTAEVYRNIRPQRPLHDLRSLLRQDIGTWKETVKNDFEAALFPLYPVLPQLKQQLYEQGALYASMTGSGSAVFGIFPKNAAKTLSFREQGYQVWLGSL